MSGWGRSTMRMRRAVFAFWNTSCSNESSKMIACVRVARRTRTHATRHDQPPRPLHSDRRAASALALEQARRRGTEDGSARRNSGMALEVWVGRPGHNTHLSPFPRNVEIRQTHVRTLRDFQAEVYAEAAVGGRCVRDHVRSGFHQAQFDGAILEVGGVCDFCFHDGARLWHRLARSLLFPISKKGQLVPGNSMVQPPDSSRMSSK